MTAIEILCHKCMQSEYVTTAGELGFHTWTMKLLHNFMTALYSVIPELTTVNRVEWDTNATRLKLMGTSIVLIRENNKTEDLKVKEQNCQASKLNLSRRTNSFGCQTKLKLSLSKSNSSAHIIRCSKR